MDGLVILPTGSSLYGSSGVGGTLSGIAEWEITSNIAFTAMLGITSQTTSSSSGGERFTSLLPDLVLSWQAYPALQFYGEVYGQTKTSPTEGPGYNFDAGVQYLITPNFEIDAEDGFRLSGNLGGFKNFIGIGMGFQI